MASVDPKTRRALVLSAGVLFIAASVFVTFGAVSWTHEYNAARVSPDDPHLAGLLTWSETTVSCGSPTDACDLAHRLRTEDSRVVSDSTYRAARGFSDDTRLVIIENATPVFYQPITTHYENDSTRVALKPVSNATALELASIPADRYPAGVQRLLENGQVRSTHPLHGWELWVHTEAILAHDGTYYRQDAFRYRGRVYTRRLVDVLRLITLAIGAGLCYHAGRIE